MLQIQCFTFGPFQENTYLLYNEAKKGIIIDPGCFGMEEKKALEAFITNNAIQLERLLLTHGHIDHILGNKFIFDTYGLLPEMHAADLPFIDMLMASAQRFGIQVEQSPKPEKFIEGGSSIFFYNDALDVLYTPGHSKGSISYYCAKQQFVINGDVLFHRSIGRTDLPGGDYNEIIDTIRHILFVLPDETVVYSGHGPATMIGSEKVSNPFLNP
jgi:hydroxyacylglutathione hydrolase